MKKILFLLIIYTYSITNFLHAQVLPLINTKWNQGSNYNADCPIVSGGRAYTGCYATALAQILKYYSHPLSAWGGNYTNTGNPVQTVNFDLANYNFSLMPNSLTGANSEVSKLIYHCGVANNMQYSNTNSTSFFSSLPLNKFFKYSLSIKGAMKSNYSNTAWENLLKNELNNGRVIFVKGAEHFFIIDGYQISPSLKFHCNFGWGGLYDNYYDIHNIIVASVNYTPGNVIIGIKPLTKIEIKEDSGNDTIDITSSGGILNYQIASLTNWTISSNQSWCIPSLTSGLSGFYNFSNGANANISSNNGYQKRYAYIIATDGTNSDTIIIRQNGIIPYVNALPNNITYSALSGVETVNIACDSNWTVSTTNSWLSISPNSGIGNGIINITALANGPISRTGSVIITRGNLQYNISLFQAASGSFWCIPSLTISGNNGITNVSLNTINRTSINNEGYINTSKSTILKNDSTYSIKVTFVGSNAPAIWIDWNIDGDFSDAGEAVMPGSGSWYPSFASTKSLNITVPSSALEGKTRMRVYAKNFGTGPVSGPCNTTDNGGDIEDYDIYIMNQKHIIVTPTSLSYLNSGSTQNLTIDCDSNWLAYTNADWITISPSSGITNASVNITTTNNSSFLSRNNVITFTRGNKIKTIAIYQNPADTILNVFPTTANFSNLGGIKSFNITSNVNYTINSNVLWLIPDITIGIGNMSINLNTTNNPTNNIRNGTITIKSGTFLQTVNVTQDSTSSILTVNPISLNFTEFKETKNTSITTPSSWNATTSDAWITINNNVGNGNFLLNVTCDTNHLISPRTGNITISNGLIIKNIGINQLGWLSTSNIENSKNLEKWIIYPNPSNGKFIIKMLDEKPFTEKIFIEIYTIYGIKINQFEITNSTTKIDLDVAKGLYFYQIKDRNQINSKKIFIVK